MSKKQNLIIRLEAITEKAKNNKKDGGLVGREMWDGEVRQFQYAIPFYILTPLFPYIIGSRSYTN